MELELIDLPYMSAQAKKILVFALLVISQMESGGNAKSIGDGGSALGHLQIHKECVDDVNLWFGTNYKHSDMFDMSKANEVFFMYMALGEDLYIKKNKRLPNEEEFVRMWNGGIYQGYKIDQTKKYYEIFKQEKAKIQKSDI